MEMENILHIQVLTQQHGQKEHLQETGNSTHPSYPYYYHASGLNTNGIKKNIADLGGNVWEWTAEIYSAGPCVTAAADAGSSAADCPASYRS